MKRRFLLLTVFAVALSAASMSQAHTPSTTTDCDTWSRGDHVTTSGAPSHHDVDHSNDVNYPLADGWTLHTSSGHYMLYKGNTYIEIVGGGTYEGEPYVQNMGEGGYVQGRIDGAGTPAAGNEVDFFTATFGPLSENMNALTWDSYVAGCVSVNNTKQGVAQTVKCPVPNVHPGINCY